MESRSGGERFQRDDGRLVCDDVDIEAVARRVGTPVYVYSAQAIRERYRAIRDAFARVEARICFSVKSCPNLSILSLLREEGAGFDVVSGGELFRVRRAGGDLEDVVFAGVGKTDVEIREALTDGVGLLNVESTSELAQVDRIAAEVGRRARVLLRVNPDVDANTHPHVTTGRDRDKFGVDRSTAIGLIAQRDRFERVDVRGFHVHIGSQVRETGPFVAALDRLVELVAEARSLGATIDTLDLGGGFGINYGEEPASPGVEVFASAMVERIRRLGCRVLLEPGRSIVGPCGVLVTEVLYVKRTTGGRRFVVVDAGFTDLLRPALYGAWHRIEPVRSREGSQAFRCDVVGPVCESADFLARDRELPAVARGDLLAVMDAGAYGFSMASNYNSRPRPSEVLIDRGRHEVIRRREGYEDLIRGEET